MPSPRHRHAAPSPLVETAVELDEDAVRIVHVEAAHPALGVGERLPWAAEGGAFGQELVHQGLRIWHRKGKVCDPQLVQLQRCTRDVLTRVAGEGEGRLFPSAKTQA